MKWPNCGYRCGLGCEEPSDEDGEGGTDGGRSDDGTAPTLIGSDDGRGPMSISHNDDDDEEFYDDQLFQDARSSFSLDPDEQPMDLLLLENGSENELLSQFNGPVPVDNHALADSLAVDSCPTDDHSRALSVRGSVGMISPGPAIGKSPLCTDCVRNMH